MGLFKDIRKKKGRAAGYNRLTSVKKKGSTLFFHDLRDMDHEKEKERYIDKEYDLSQLSELYMYQSPFGYGEWVAHIMLEFVFHPDKGSRKKPQSLFLSVEARRDPGEGYSFLKGFLRQYGLIFIWGTKKDVLRLRKKRDEKVFRYKLQFTPYEIQQGLLYFIKRSNGLISRPEYYHVFTNNCAVNLRNAFHLKGKDKPLFSLKVVSGAGIPAYLYKLGYLERSKSFEELKKEARYEI